MSTHGVCKIDFANQIWGWIFSDDLLLCFYTNLLYVCLLFFIVVSLPAEEPGSLGSVARLGHEQANCIRINLRWVVLAWKILR